MHTQRVVHDFHRSGTQEVPIAEMGLRNLVRSLCLKVAGSARDGAASAPEPGTVRTSHPESETCKSSTATPTLGSEQGSHPRPVLKAWPHPAIATPCGCKTASPKAAASA